MKKILICSYVVLSILGFNSLPAKASILSFIPTDDTDLRYTINPSFPENISTNTINENYFGPGHVVYTWNGSGNADRIEFVIPYLKFDISSIDKNFSIVSAKLKMTNFINQYVHRHAGILYGDTGIFEENNAGNVNLYYVQDDNWNEGTLYRENEVYDAIVNNQSSSFNWGNRPIYDQNDYISTGIDYYTNMIWDIPIEDIVNDFLSDGIISFAIENKLTSSNDYGLFFYSKETWDGNSVVLSEFAPELILEVNQNSIPTPAPEPSSMVYGLMGLGSLFGFRRRNSR